MNDTLAFALKKMWMKALHCSAAIVQYIWMDRAIIGFLKLDFHWTFLKDDIPAYDMVMKGEQTKQDGECSTDLNARFTTSESYHSLIYSIKILKNNLLNLYPL